MKLYYFLILLLWSSYNFAQTTYKETVTIPPHETITYEVPGADGDAIQIDLKHQSGSKLAMDVSIFPKRHFFDEADFKDIRRIITVTIRGVYVIKLINENDKATTYNVLIESKNFTGLPVTLEHKVVRDTIYGYPSIDANSQRPKRIPIITSKIIPVVEDL